LLWISGATLAGGVLSVVAAAAIAFGALAKWLPRLVSYAVGALLGAAFLHVVPEALARARFLKLQQGPFAQVVDADTLFATMLAGVLGFFLLEKAALWRHFHAHGTSVRVKSSGMLIIVGDGFHNFVDGIIIAAAFLVDTRLGVATTLAVIAHEVPQELGDYMILIDAGYSRGRALVYNLVSSVTSIAGGITGYFVLGHALAVVPFVLMISAASFVYIAIADLIPDLRRTNDDGGTVWQVALITTGVATSAVPYLLRQSL
jgi:zinc and cadmium transporter